MFWLHSTNNKNFSIFLKGYVFILNARKSIAE